MLKFTGISLRTLTDRLGQASGKRLTVRPGAKGHTFHMLWFCSGPQVQACFAYAQAMDTPMPSGLTPWEQELFDHAGFPKEGWTIQPCPQHVKTFADHSKKSD